MEVDFICRLRDIRRFGSVDELKSQLDQDIAQARKATSPIAVEFP
jgi:FAD synthase